MATTNITIKDSFGEHDWSRFADVNVLVPWRPDPTMNEPTAPYREQLVIGGSNVSVIAVPGPNGERPVISGKGVKTDPQFKVTYGPTRRNGLVSVFSLSDTYTPKNITIQGFEICGASFDNPDRSFTNYLGQPDSWGESASAIYATRFNGLSILDCVLRDCGNGLFTGDSKECQNLLIQRCKFFGNGRIGSVYEHNSYSQAAGTTIEDCEYGDLRPGAKGGAAKGRDARFRFRRNRVRAQGRCVDLGSWQNEYRLRASIEGATTSEITDNVLINYTDAALVYIEGRTLANGTSDDVIFARNTCVIRTPASRAGFVRIFANEYNPRARVRSAGNLYDRGPGTPPVRLADAQGSFSFGREWTNWKLDTGTITAGFKRTLFGLENIVDGSNGKVAIAPGYANEAAGDYSLPAGAPASGYGPGSAAPLPAPPPVIVVDPVVPPVPPIPPVVPPVSPPAPTWTPVAEWIDPEANGYRVRRVLEKKGESAS